MQVNFESQRKMNHKKCVKAEEATSIK